MALCTFSMLFAPTQLLVSILVLTNSLVQFPAECNTLLALSNSSFIVVYDVSLVFAYSSLVLHVIVLLSTAGDDLHRNLYVTLCESD